jgi:hypothetical protein
MNVSLKHFLQTGSLGLLHLGMSAQEVLDLLGPPDYGDVTFQDEQSGGTWQYGTFGISFGDEYNQLEGLASIEWTPVLGEPRLPSSCDIEDWDITAEMKPLEIKTYLRNTGLKFHYQSAKGYFVREPVASWMSPVQADLAQNHGRLNMKKPKNEADIVRVMTFFTFFLPSEVRIVFVDDRLLHIGIFGYLR